MVFPKARLVVAAALFLGWIGFLAYLVAITRDPVILSRPQILVSNVCVLADIEEQDGRPKSEVTVTEVLWADDGDKSLEKQKLVLPDLAELDRPQGWAGKGSYLLPLTRRTFEKQSKFELAPIPPMPGFRPTVSAELAEAGSNPDKVAQYLQKALAVDAQTAKRMTQRPGILARFLPAGVAIDLKSDLEKLGARVHLEEYETRVYRATDDALRQFRELKY
jgi:hypothetical protein